MDPILAGKKERAWREIRDIDDAHDRGELDDEGWHRAMAALVVPAYLGAPTPEGGSGHSGTRAEWDWSRGVIMDAIDRDGTFLDVGCANGLLMESVVRWGAARALAVEPYGLEIAPALAAVARERIPNWSQRIDVGNALGYQPSLRFDFVRTNLEYAPPPRRGELVAWLLARVVRPGGRLIIGKYNEEVNVDRISHELQTAGFSVCGRASRAHRSEPRLLYKIVWIDA